MLIHLESNVLEVVWPPFLSHVTICISYLSLSKKSHNTVSAYLLPITFPCRIAHHEGFTNNLFIVQDVRGDEMSAQDSGYLFAHT